MFLIVMLTASILLQFAAAWLAFRLVRITQNMLAWLLISAAILLMALRRSISLYQTLLGESPTPLDQSAELVGLVISILLVIGMAKIAPLFLAIKRSGEEFRLQLLQTCMDGIIANDRSGKIIACNQTAARILGYKPEEVIGKLNVREIYPPGMAKEIKRKICTQGFGGQGIIENYETVVRHKDGTLIPIWLSARIFCEDGQDMGVVGHFRDLRERKRLEEELLQNERLSALGRMAAHISHEIKNPLMLIGGFARQVLKDSSGEPSKNKEKLQIIVEEIRRLEDFLGEVGSYAKFSEPQKSPGDLNRLIQDVCLKLEPVLEERGVELVLHLDADLPLVAFDAGLLHLVIVNLVKNGVEAMPGAGTLTIASGRQDGRVFVEIADTGEGMGPETLQQIFQPFFSTKPKGSGLGLAISQKIIQAHQGEITVESEPQKGCRVRCWLKPES